MFGSDREKYNPKVVAQLAEEAISLDKLKHENYSILRKAIGDAQVVLIGEATHGTEEFYRERAEITKILIEQMGFNFVAVEGDWPDCYRVNRFVNTANPPKTGSASGTQTSGQLPKHPIDSDPSEALSGFQRFPRWMWSNKVTAEFISWLRTHNQVHHPQPADRVGFFGLDLYSMFTSAEEVVKYLQAVDPPLAEVVRARYATLGQFRDDYHNYAIALATDAVESQRENCTQVLVALLKHRLAYTSADSYNCKTEFWTTEENAKLVKDAEEYYRKTFSYDAIEKMRGVVSWNLRDTHFANTFDDIVKHYTALKETKGTPSSKLSAADNSNADAAVAATATTAGTKVYSGVVRGVVWAHNSHVGDSAATAFGAIDELNIGNLLRTRYGLEKTFNIGFTTFNGTVSAAESWGGERQTMIVNDAMKGSYEWLFHATSLEMRSRELVTPATKVQIDSKATTTKSSSGDQGSASTNQTIATATSKALRVSRGSAAPQGANFAILLRSNAAQEVAPSQNVTKILKPARYERAIGVQYVKATEFQSHYIECTLPKQFDCVIHIDQTSCLIPLPGKMPR